MGAGEGGWKKKRIEEEMRNPRTQRVMPKATIFRGVFQPSAVSHGHQNSNREFLAWVLDSQPISIIFFHHSRLRQFFPSVGKKMGSNLHQELRTSFICFTFKRGDKVQCFFLFS